jgi:hypothetical protein
LRHLLRLLLERRLPGAGAALLARLDACSDVARLEQLVVDVGSTADLWRGASEEMMGR